MSTPEETDGSLNANEALTLRDHFAAKAMLGIIGNSAIAIASAKVKENMTPEEVQQWDKVIMPKVTAMASYVIADAMLTERNK